MRHEGAVTGRPGCSPAAPCGRPLAWLALLLSLVVAAYARTIGFAYVWDDLALLVGNPVVRGESPFREIFTADYVAGTSPGVQGWMFRPLALVSFRWEWALSPHPAWGHAINVALHVLTTGLVWSIGRRLGASFMAASLAAAGFALFPGQIEAVAWVSGRPDLLAGFFLAGAIFLMASPLAISTSRALAVCLLTGAACLCKETALLVAPIVALAAGLGMRASAGWLALRPVVAVFVAWVAVVALRVRALGGFGLQPQQGAKLDLGTQLARLGEQIACLHGFDPRAVMAVPEPGPARWGMMLLIVVAIAGVAWAVAGLRRRGAWLAAGLVCAAMIALLPVMRLRWPSLRYWYLPTMCLAPPAGLGLARGFAGTRPRTVLVSLVALLAAWTVFGQLRLPAWRSEARLFATEAELQPDNADVLYFHAQRTALDGRPDLAVPIYEAALTRAPGHRPSWLGLGRALLALGRPAAAENVARQSLRGEPRTWPQFMLLGDALAGQEKWGDARKAYDQALTNAPSVPDVLIAAARAARVTGDPERAQALARRALGVDPRDQRASALIAVPAAPK